jgi:excisionase family DNA binding protein
MSRHKKSSVNVPQSVNAECLRTHDVARILGISQEQVMRLMRKKQLPGFRLGRLWMVRRIELEDYLAQLSKRSTSENV